MDPAFEVERLCSDFVKAQAVGVVSLRDTLRDLTHDRVATYERKFPAFTVSERLGFGGVEQDLRAMRLRG